MLKAVALPSTQFLILACVGLLLRISTFGDPNLHIDESFYLLVGQEMHRGAIPYVDIWDRKPLGLFIAYWFFAAFPDGVLAYQIGAWLSASLTAFIICRIAIRWMPWDAALVGGLLYLVMLGPMLGMGGQAPVLYNSFVAGAAYLVLQFIDGQARWRLFLAMLLLGIAITFKQTACFEAAFFGLLAVWHHRNWRIAAVQVAIGAAPFAAIAGWYAMAGYWAQFYQAMITANLTRPSMNFAALGHNSRMFLTVMGPLLTAVLYAFAFARDRFDARFMALWIFAATLGFLSVTYIIGHYALPLLVPLCLVAGASFTRRVVGVLILAFTAIVAIVITAPQDFELHRKSKSEFRKMVAAIGPTQRLLVFDGPPLLYSATGTHPLSPLVFPHHLWDWFEKDQSPFKSGAELERIIALRPTAVVMRDVSAQPPDPVALRHLEEYVRTHCRPPVRALKYTPYGMPYAHRIYGGCRDTSEPEVVDRTGAALIGRSTGS